MPGRAKSDTVKAHIECKNNDQQMKEAVAAYLKDQGAGGKRRGARYFGDKYGVSYKTILRHADGNSSMSEFNSGKQKLSPAQEQILVDYLTECANRGLPFTHEQLYIEATYLYHMLNDPDVDPLSKEWVK